MFIEKSAISFFFIVFRKIRKWINDSYLYWDGLREKEDASQSGVMQLSVYCYSSTDASIVRVTGPYLYRSYSNRCKKPYVTYLHVSQNHYLEGLVPLYRRCTEDELRICPGDWKYGSFYTTLLTDTRLWQAWARQR